MRDLTGRVAVVTGAASGIGLAIAEALIGEGMKVMLSDVDEARLSAQETRLAGAGATVASSVVDVGDPHQVEALAATVINRFGGRPPRVQQRRHRPTGLDLGTSTG
jgi:NAD(P)-dependent dehydrogenase (short-subunit alcohol dehydrogenase family)